MNSSGRFFYKMLLKLQQKENYLKQKKWNELLTKDADFKFFVSLVYMLMTKEKIIYKDRHIKQTGKRLAPLVDESRIKDLFLDKDSYKIYSATNTDEIWLFDVIRDSILHRKFYIDYDNRLVKINNSDKYKTLICDFSFEWFNKYSEEMLSNYKKTNKESYVYFIDCNYDPMHYVPQTVDMIRRYFNKAMCLEITAYGKNNSEVEIHKLSDVLDYVRYGVIANIDFSKLFEQALTNAVAKYGVTDINTLMKNSKHEVKKIVISEIINIYKQKKDKNGFGNFEISISDINIADDEYDKIFQYFINNKLYDISSQNERYSKFVEHVGFYFNKNRNNIILNCISVLYSFFSIEKDNELPKEVIETILSDDNLISLYEKIHSIRNHNDDTYDKIILNNINVSLEDKLRIEKEIRIPYMFVNLGMLNKDSTIDLYNKYTKILKDNNEISDQDIIFAGNKKIIQTTVCLEYIKSHSLFVEIAILYLMGLGIFSVNKDLLDNIDISNIDFQNTTGVVKDYKSGMFVSANYDNILRIIRNVFSHENRITISDIDTRKLILTDKNNNGEVSGIVYTSIDDLFKLFTNNQLFELIDSNSDKKII